jgi:hypothetical protein
MKLAKYISQLAHKNIEENDPFVAGYKYAKEQLLNSEKLTISSFNKYMIDKGFEDKQLNMMIFMSMVLPGYEQGNMGSTNLYVQGYPGSGDAKFDMLPQAYFNLIDMLELSEARKNAGQAKKYSVFAIIISIIATIAAILSVLQTQSVEINSNQFKLIVEAIRTSPGFRIGE